MISISLAELPLYNVTARSNQVESEVLRIQISDSLNFSSLSRCEREEFQASSHFASTSLHQSQFVQIPKPKAIDLRLKQGSMHVG
jgi:hypothetical protein